MPLLRRDQVTVWKSERLLKQALGLCGRLNERWLGYLNRSEEPPKKFVAVAVRAMLRYRRRLWLARAVRQEKNLEERQKKRQQDHQRSVGEK